MKDEQTVSEADAADLSVEGIEAALDKSPQDLEVMKDLTCALLDRYLYGADDKSGGDEVDLQRVRTLVAGLPEPLAMWPRAYLALVDGKDDEAAKWLALHATYMTDEKTPIDCDTLYLEFLEPFW